MLLATSVVTGANAVVDVTTTERHFKAAAKETAPTDRLNVAEFKVYDLAQGRPDSASQRNIDFSDADANGDESIDWAEALGHEQMLEHFKADPTKTVAGMTRAEVDAAALS